VSARTSQRVAHREAGAEMTRHSQVDGTIAGREAQRLRVWQALSAAALLVMGGIHVFLVLQGFGGLLGTLFVLNGIGGLVLAIAIVAAPRRFLPVVSVLSLLFLVGTLLGLLIALTPAGLLGIHEQIDGQLVPTTLVVESLGALVLVATTILAFRGRRSG
jgi:uncharacterized membrane protein YccC